MKGKRRKIGFSYAWNGLKDIYQSEFNFRIHVTIAFLVFFFGVVFQLTKMEWIIVISVIGFVLVVEIINSVIERIIDYVKPEYHPHAKFIKDAAAAAVLISAAVAAIIGIIIFFPKLYELYLM
ncbi:diacylglycerol kinase [Oceanobacillus salinisoli]|uniref:diacylglycerol kinase n=1 Tax=Oceanobacillus salinisoli TaxID=2678611 RepID=UPI0018CC696E|nr:diacylglycerol kinase [Oceanobacillus salinisoli]